ncbi:MAG: peptide/nickel transport system ATP-binding protein [Halieaceae bacterium]|jgi:peptide/nickel transport system ATP-binding protein
MLLRVQGVYLNYAEHPVLEDFSLEVSHGEFVGLTGPPGCGKSTAALAMLGLVRHPGTISAGRVLLGKRDLLIMDHAAASTLRGREIALVTQGPRGALHPLISVGEQMVNVLRAGGDMDRRSARKEAVAWLQRVGIQDPAARMNAYVHELSTGMAQRVVFAMALCRKPALLVADEPTSGLDVTIQAQVLDDLAATARRLGTSVLLITQDISLIAQYCQRVVVMDTGRIVEEQSVENFFSAPQHAYSRSVVALAAAEPGAGGEKPGADLLLEVDNARKVFGGKSDSSRVIAVDDVTLHVHRGETLGLVGESGSGKTTLARCLLQLETLDAGTVKLGGKALVPTHSSAQYRTQRAAMQVVFQDPLDSMNPRWPVEKIIAEPLTQLTDLSRGDRRARVGELLRRVGLPEAVAGARPAALSAGEQQRVAVARAMATEPAFIVLDEPTSALDPQARADLLVLLRRLQEAFGVSYLFISHDLASIRHGCHRVAVLYLGQIVEEGSARQIFEAPAHPYTRALIDASVTGSAQSSERVRLSGEIANALRDGCYLSARCPFSTPQCRQEKQELISLEDGRRIRCMRALRGELHAGPETSATTGSLES